MPIWLVKLFPYLAAALALGAAVWYIDHRGYKRAETEAKLEKAQDERDRAYMREQLNRAVRSFEVKLQGQMNASDLRLSTRLSQLRTEQQTIVQPTIVKEIRDAPRLSDPNAGLTDGLWRALNAARSASANPCPAGTLPADCVGMSAAQPAQR